MKTRSMAAVIVASTIACQPDAEPLDRSGVQQRDSAGIHIVENPRSPDASRLGWRIDPEPVVSIGVLEGDEAHLLFQASDAIRLADGRIVIANRGSAELRIFDSNGIHLATRGGLGEGPGEFADLWRVERWPGDSIVAWYAPGRGAGMSVFDADGNYGRTFRLEDVGVLFSPSFATTDGSILATRIPEGGDTAVFQLRDGEGRVRSSFGTHPGSEPYRMTADGRRQLSWKTFGRKPVWATWGHLVAIGHTGRYEIKGFRADGSLERIVRRDLVPRTPTPADIEANILARMGGTRGMSDAEAAPRQGGVVEPLPGSAGGGAPPRIRIDHDRCGGPPVGRGIRVAHGRLPRASLDGLRPGGAGAGILRDTEGLAHPRDRRGLLPRSGPERTRSRIRPALAPGQIQRVDRGNRE